MLLGDRRAAEPNFWRTISLPIRQFGGLCWPLIPRCTPQSKLPNTEQLSCQQCCCHGASQPVIAPLYEGGKNTPQNTFESDPSQQPPKWGGVAAEMFPNPPRFGVHLFSVADY